MRNVNAKLGATMILLAMCAVPMNAQKKKAKIAEKDSLTTASVGRDADNMMLNASDESTPRFINVGLPVRGEKRCVSKFGRSENI